MPVTILKIETGRVVAGDLRRAISRWLEKIVLQPRHLLDCDAGIKGVRVIRGRGDHREDVTIARVHDHDGAAAFRALL